MVDAPTYHGAQDGERFVATLHMLSTEQGGRKTPFRTNYRPQLYLNDPAASTSCFIHTINGGDEVRPGETATVEASLLNATILENALTEKTKFWLREGGRDVGWGIIERLFHDAQE